MILLDKNTPNYECKLEITYPRFIWRRRTRTFRKLDEEYTEMTLNLFCFKLTNNKKYFIVELGLVIGIRLLLIDKE